MTRLRAEDALPGRSVARRAFQRSAASFDSARVLHDEARARLLERLAPVRLQPRRVVDLGCATGAGTVALAERFPQARVLALDASTAMLARAAARGATQRGLDFAAADAEQLPLRAGSVDLLFANLLLPWCAPPAVFAEAARVLTEGGLFAFSTFGPDTLQEVRRAWAGIDDRVHVHGFFDMHDLGDLAVAAGLAEPVLDVDRIELTYQEVARLRADLRATGAVNVAPGRRRTLTGRRRWARFEQALRGHASSGRFRVTVELVFGQAWGAGGGRRRAAGGGEVGIPVEDIHHRGRPGL